jgi:hypothetical protein
MRAALGSTARQGKGQGRAPASGLAARRGTSNQRHLQLGCPTAGQGARAWRVYCCCGAASQHTGAVALAHCCAGACTTAMSTVRVVRPRPLGNTDRIPVFWAGQEPPPELKAIDGGALWRHLSASLLASAPAAAGGRKRKREAEQQQTYAAPLEGEAHDHFSPFRRPPQQPVRAVPWCCLHPVASRRCCCCWCC